MPKSRPGRARAPGRRGLALAPIEGRAPRHPLLAARARRPVGATGKLQSLGAIMILFGGITGWTGLAFDLDRTLATAVAVIGAGSLLNATGRARSASPGRALAASSRFGVAAAGFLVVGGLATDSSTLLDAAGLLLGLGAAVGVIDYLGAIDRVRRIAGCAGFLLAAAGAALPVLGPRGFAAVLLLAGGSVNNGLTIRRHIRGYLQSEDGRRRSFRCWSTIGSARAEAPRRARPWPSP